MARFPLCTRFSARAGSAVCVWAVVNAQWGCGLLFGGTGYIQGAAQGQGSTLPTGGAKPAFLPNARTSYLMSPMNNAKHLTARLRPKYRGVLVLGEMKAATLG